MHGRATQKSYSGVQLSQVTQRAIIAANTNLAGFWQAVERREKDCAWLSRSSTTPPASSLPPTVYVTKLCWAGMLFWTQDGDHHKLGPT